MGSFPLTTSVLIYIIKLRTCKEITARNSGNKSNAKIKNQRNPQACPGREKRKKSKENRVRKTKETISLNHPNSHCHNHARKKKPPGQPTARIRIHHIHQEETAKAQRNRRPKPKPRTTPPQRIPGGGVFPQCPLTLGGIGHCWRGGKR